MERLEASKSISQRYGTDENKLGRVEFNGDMSIIAA